MDQNCKIPECHMIKNIGKLRTSDNCLRSSIVKQIQKEIDAFKQESRASHIISILPTPRQMHAHSKNKTLYAEKREEAKNAQIGK